MQHHYNEENKHQAEVILAQKAMIASLSDAVSRLASTIQSKEEIIKSKQEEIRIRDRAEGYYESKNLDLLIEIAELKNQVADLKEKLSSNLEQQSTFVCKKDNNLRHDESYEPFEFLDDEYEENTKEDNDLHDRILSPPDIVRRSMPMKKLFNININVKPRVCHPSTSVSSGSRFGTAKSRLTPKKGHAFAWDWDEDHTLIPKQINFPTELKLSPISDEVSDISA